jgi:hypothetical protein
VRGDGGKNFLCWARFEWRMRRRVDGKALLLWTFLSPSIHFRSVLHLHERLWFTDFNTECHILKAQPALYLIKVCVHNVSHLFDTNVSNKIDPPPHFTMLVMLSHSCLSRFLFWPHDFPLPHPPFEFSCRLILPSMLNYISKTVDFCVFGNPDRVNGCGSRAGDVRTAGRTLSSFDGRRRRQKNSKGGRERGKSWGQTRKQDKQGWDNMTNIVKRGGGSILFDTYVYVSNRWLTGCTHTFIKYWAGRAFKMWHSVLKSVNQRAFARCPFQHATNQVNGFRAHAFTWKRWERCNLSNKSDVLRRRQMHCAIEEKGGEIVCFKIGFIQYVLQMVTCTV